LVSHKRTYDLRIIGRLESKKQAFCPLKLFTFWLQDRDNKMAGDWTDNPTVTIGFISKEQLKQASDQMGGADMKIR
jgi:hypothetical protein